MPDFNAKMHQNRFRLGLRPRPRWGSLQRSPRPPSSIWGSTSKGRGGEGTRGEEREGKGRGGKGKKEGRGGEGGEERGDTEFEISALFGSGLMRGSRVRDTA